MRYFVARIVLPAPVFESCTSHHRTPFSEGPYPTNMLSAKSSMSLTAFHNYKSRNSSTHVMPGLLEALTALGVALVIHLPSTKA